MSYNRFLSTYLTKSPIDYCRRLSFCERNGSLVTDLGKCITYNIGSCNIWCAHVVYLIEREIYIKICHRPPIILQCSRRGKKSVACVKGENMEIEIN